LLKDAKCALGPTSIKMVRSEFKSIISEMKLQKSNVNGLRCA
jgi:hypothetical protein